MPAYETNAAYMAIMKADMLIVGGTSLTVQPAAGLINYFSGKHLVVINKENIDVMTNPETDLVFNTNLGEVFKAVDDALYKENNI